MTELDKRFENFLDFVKDAPGYVKENLMCYYYHNTSACSLCPKEDCKAREPRSFAEQAEAEGFTFADGTKPSERPDETFVCLNLDHTLSFIGMFGRQAYGSGTNTTCGKTLVRVEYGKLFKD